MHGPTQHSTSPIRFGFFEARTDDLRKHGVRVKLQDQPLKILLILLERAGELVTREELQSRLWPADTFVDFERGLNRAVNKLRQVLGDDSENPRFIETVPRRGYRFIAPVEKPEPVVAPETSPPPHGNPSGLSRGTGGRLQVRTERDRGIGSIPSGAPAPYHAVGHLFFRTMAELECALEATAAEFVADERNYTNVPSLVQISEVVE